LHSCVNAFIADLDGPFASAFSPSVNDNANTGNTVQASFMLRSLFLTSVAVPCGLAIYENKMSFTLLLLIVPHYQGMYGQDMNILIVEDEATILKNLTITLETEGWTVKTAQSLPALATVVESKNFYPHIIILDRILGSEDSATMIDKIKNRFIETRILVLSAIDTGSEKAKLLDMGADDYISKPFSSQELVSRIKALSRRSSLVKSLDELQVGNLSLNQYLRSSTVEGAPLPLTQKEFQLLILFANNPGKIFPKSILMEKIWNTEKDSESKVVEATMNNLRRKLEATPANVQIKNIRNVGYWLET
jgi:DNA-binding response OmpR family regulator